MRPARSIERVLLVLVMVHACTIAVALCRAPYDTLLDEGLQRALLVGAIEAGGGALSVPDVVDDPEGEDAEVVVLVVEDVLTSSSFALDVDCRWMLDAWMILEPEGLPPSVVPPSFHEVTDLEHARWYLLSAAPGSYQDVYDELLNLTSFYADAAYAFPRLELFLVHVSTLEQFSNLLGSDFRALLSHVMENYPLRPAWDSAIESIGYSASPLAAVDGEGLAIAIIDTGVDPEHFGDRILHEACFSSKALLVRDAYLSNSICNTGEPVAQDWDVVFEGDPNAVGVYFSSSATAGEGSGTACSMDFECRHGTKVAYIAAGVQSESSESNTKKRPSGLAPAADIVAIQVASEAPKAYCKGEVGLDGTCTVIFPLDVLRALAYLEDRQRANPPWFDEGRLVAVNLSVQVNHFCHKNEGVPEQRLELCVTNPDMPLWVAASYADPCDHNEFGERVRALRDLGVWTVIAAGNQTSNNEVGVVSLPACVDDAITVAGVLEEGPPHVLWSTSMFGNQVDVAAPGADILTPVGADSTSGTSFAAPQVAGALVLIRELMLERCSGTRMEDERDWLMQGAQELTIWEWKLPDFSLTRSLDDVVLSLAGESFPCPASAGSR